MVTNTNLSTDVTMESLLSEVRRLKAELSELQAQERLQNLSLDERGRERTHHHHHPRRQKPHNTKIQYFANLPGENFLAWQSRFQVII